jgi:hypothetical protein
MLNISPGWKMQCEAEGYPYPKYAKRTPLTTTSQVIEIEMNDEKKYRIMIEEM